MTDYRVDPSPEQRVRDLHRRVEFVPAEVFWRASKKPVDICEHCTDLLIEADTEGGYAGALYQEWPCPTIQALEGDKS